MEKFVRAASFYAVETAGNATGTVPRAELDGASSSPFCTRTTDACGRAEHLEYGAVCFEEALVAQVQAGHIRLPGAGHRTVVSGVDEVRCAAVKE